MKWNIIYLQKVDLGHFGERYIRIKIISNQFVDLLRLFIFYICIKQKYIHINWKTQLFQMAINNLKDPKHFRYHRTFRISYGVFDYSKFSDLKLVYRQKKKS